MHGALAFHVMQSLVEGAASRKWEQALNTWVFNRLVPDEVRGFDAPLGEQIPKRISVEAPACDVAAVDLNQLQERPQPQVT